MFLFGPVSIECQIIFFQHYFKFGLNDKSVVFVGINHRLLRNDPYFIKGVHRDIGCTEFLIGFFPDALPKFPAGVFLGIHQRRSELFQEIILFQEFASHQGVPETFGDNPVSFIGRKINPHFFFRCC